MPRADTEGSSRPGGRGQHGRGKGHRLSPCADRRPERARGRSRAVSKTAFTLEVKEPRSGVPLLPVPHSHREYGTSSPDPFQGSRDLFRHSLLPCDQEGQDRQAALQPPAPSRKGRQGSLLPASASEDIFRELGTNAQGWRTSEAAKRLKRYGPNVLKEVKRKSLFLRFAENLTNLFAVLLWVGGILAFVADMPELGWAIFAVILVNARLQLLAGVQGGAGAGSAQEADSAEGQGGAGRRAAGSAGGGARARRHHHHRGRRRRFGRCAG